VKLAEVSELIAEVTGLHFPRNRWGDLERGIYFASREFGFKDVESCLQWLFSSLLSKNQIEVLASHLTIGETYFFREKKIFEILEGHILPGLISSRCKTEKRIRIWSAACATGEEPYSIAILLSKILPDLQNWRVTILATDINPLFLKKASEGIYSEWSFRGTPLWVREGYFIKKNDGRFEILNEIKKMVTFSYLNLVEDAYPSLLTNTNAVDIIFCRNVLMYFNPRQTEKVIQKLFHSLIDGGWLIVSPSETSAFLRSLFVFSQFSGAILYQKALRKSRLTTDVVFSEPHYNQQTEETKTQLRSPSMSPTPVNSILTHRLEITLTTEPVESLPFDDGPSKAMELPISLHQEALALYEQGRYEEASKKLQEKISLSHGNAKDMALLARAYANQGKLDEALNWSEQAATADKLNPRSHFLLATILQECGRIKEAASSLRRALYLDQDFVLAHFALGNLTRSQGKLGESARHFKNALSLLNLHQPKDILPESEGMTAGRLRDIVYAIVCTEVPA
jgi:chemotaxis protein methyltransferase CheR